MSPLKVSAWDAVYLEGVRMNLREVLKGRHADRQKIDR